MDVNARAGEKIVLKAGTTIKSDSEFVAKVKPFSNNTTIHTPTIPVYFSQVLQFSGVISDYSGKGKI
ncbi:MAG: hypothetical protein LBV69_04645 [Bacteroidales bacterium]|nr:hypothetical protein [Bacteroidales bacterium]